MNTNRIANIDDQPDEIISMGYIAGQCLALPFFTVTLNENNKFQLFFDEDAYRQEVAESECAVDDAAVDEECRFYTEEIEIALNNIGGV